MKRMFLPLVIVLMVIGLAAVMNLAPERIVSNVAETVVEPTTDEPAEAPDEGTAEDLADSPTESPTEESAEVPVTEETEPTAPEEKVQAVEPTPEVAPVPMERWLADADLVPHRALYSMRLLHGGGIVGAEGVMTMSIEHTCDGWVFSQDLSAIFAMDGGTDVRQKAVFTSWEADDGSAFEFASRIETGGVVEETRGRASMAPDGGNADYTLPTQATISLDGQTLFPVSHTAWLIEEARLGNHTASRVVFTGSEELAPEIINAFIGEEGDRSDAPEGMTLPDDPLMQGQGWPMTLAFFDLSANEGLPTFEMRTYQLANGVAPWLIMDFGDFSTLLTVEKIEAVAAPECS